MRTLPFAQPGRFFRGNLHAHSTRSDGRLAPDQVIAAYRAEGYDFLALTDHFMDRFGHIVTDTRDLRSPDFTTLLGAELHGPALENGGLWHIVAVGLPLDFPPEGLDESGASLAARARAAGAFVGIAHPAWNGVSLTDAQSIATAHAIEIHNEGHTRDSDRGSGWYLADLLATRGHRLTAFAADDAHFGERPDRFGGWVQVRAETLDPAALLAALKAGHYYSSQGPTIEDVSLDDGRLAMSCSPAAAIYVGGPGQLCRWVRDESGTGLTSASFPLAPFLGAYCRITILAATGQRAWTNPIWLDDEAVGGRR